MQRKTISQVYFFEQTTKIFLFLLNNVVNRILKPSIGSAEATLSKLQLGCRVRNGELVLRVNHKVLTAVSRMAKRELVLNVLFNRRVGKLTPPRLRGK